MSRLDHTDADTSVPEERPDPAEVPDQATAVLVSYRAPEVGLRGDDGWEFGDSAWIREGMNEPSYLRYLRYAHAGPVAVGDEWDEFVNCGCASPMDVVLRVERVEGGSAIGLDTDLEVVPRKDLVAGA
jgi:hypothetical protein